MNCVFLELSAKSFKLKVPILVTFVYFYIIIGPL